MPHLRDKPVAVCGNTEERTGIVLAKNDAAKKCGIITGEVVVFAVRKCPQLVVLPPHYEKYVEYSKRVKEIYYNYTDLIESFGIDECWLDLTGSEKLFGSGYEMAVKISREVYTKTGLTVSIGVSYNKVFAKLGSDMKKPNGITCITQENFKEKVWDLPASAILGIGEQAAKKLKSKCIGTIGKVAAENSDNLRRWFGKCGLTMWINANGLDISPVMPVDYVLPVKTIGHGKTTTKDLINASEASYMFQNLSLNVGQRLRTANLRAKGVKIAVRDNKMGYREYQMQLPSTTQSSMVLAEHAKTLMKKKYRWDNPVRALEIRAINLVPAGTPEQLNFFTDYERQNKLEAIEKTIDAIRHKYGELNRNGSAIINTGTHYRNDLKIVKDKTADQLPMTMFL